MDSVAILRVLRDSEDPQGPSGISRDPQGSGWILKDSEGF